MSLPEHPPHADHAAHPGHADHAQHSPQHHGDPGPHDRHGGHDGHGGHDKHAGHDPEAFRRKFWLSLTLTAVILALDEHFTGLLGLPPLAVPGRAWLLPALGAALYGYGGWPFLEGAVRELRARVPGMMTLVALGISVAFFYSLAVWAGLSGGMALWWELATLVTIMLLGHWIEMRSVEGASRALDELAALVPDTARRLTGDGGAEDVPVAALRVGDRVLVRPGERVPADGKVTEGASSLNEAFLTGESRPVPKVDGDEVVAGAVNGEGALTVRVDRIGEDTALSQVRRLVAEAQASRGRFQALADRAAGWLTYVAVGAGALTLGVWLALGAAVDFAVVRTVTVLVMACPHALGLAIPLVVVNATGVAARHGLLVRNREAFERARALEIVAFDKTGTLTEGRHAVRRVAASGVGEEEALRIAAALEARSEHPLAAAIVEEARKRGVAGEPVEGFEVAAGRGVAGRVGGRAYRIGRPEWAEEIGVALPGDLRRALAEADERGEGAVVLFDDEAALAVVALADQVRARARDAVDRLRADGVTPVMITGDAEAVARTVAAELGIEEVHARVLPADKAALVRRLRQRGPTAFVGDGINDAAALLEADLGVAVGAGTNVAIESADVVLAEDDPMGVVRVRRLSAATYRKMVQNLVWATGYNAVALPLAAGVLYGVGVVLTPAAGAVLMSASTVIVAVNAVLLRRVSLD